MKLFLLLLSCLVGLTSADYLNEYFSDKVIGPNPGPCTSKSRCYADAANIKDPAILNIMVCLFGENSGCRKLGELLKSGTMEVWDLTCSGIDIAGMKMTRTATLAELLTANVDLTQVMLSCSFVTNVRDLTLGLTNSFQIVVGIDELAVKFPNKAGNRAKFGATVDVELSTDSSKGETFQNSLPNQIALPRNKCNIRLDMGLGLNWKSMSKLSLCAHFFGKWRCADIIKESGSFVDWLLKIFHVDKIMAALVNLLQGLIGIIACRIVEQAAIISPTEQGYLNVMLNNVKTQVDTWGDSPKLNPAQYDKNSYLESIEYVSAEKLANSVDFKENTVVELLSVTLNKWLGAPSTTPGYEGRLVVDEIIDAVTDPKGYAKLDLGSLGVAPSFLLPLEVANMSLKVNYVAFDQINTINKFQLLQNNYDSGDPSKQFRYTMLNHLGMKNFKFEVQVDTFWAPGDWITSGTNTYHYNFTMGAEMQDLDLSFATLSLLNPAEVAGVKVGQLTDLDLSSPSTINPVIHCLGPAAYLFNFSNLEMSVGTVGNFSLVNPDQSGLGAFVEQILDYSSAAVNGALKTKLQGISRGPVRQLLNEVIYNNITTNVGVCPRWTGPKHEGPQFVDLDSPTLSFILSMIDLGIGGDPIKGHDGNINQLIKILLNYASDNYSTFPFDYGPDPSNPRNTIYGLKPYLQNNFKLQAFHDKRETIGLTNFQVFNIDSLYKLRIFNVSNGGVAVKLGLGGVLDNTPVIGGPITFGPTVFFSLPSKGVSEQFRMKFTLTHIDTAFTLSHLEVIPDFYNALILGNVAYLRCIIGTLNEVEFLDSMRSLSLQRMQFFIDNRINRSTSSSDLSSAITALETEGNSTQGIPTKNGNVEHFTNTVLNGSMNYTLNLVEEAPQEYGDVSPTNCSTVPFPLPFSNSSWIHKNWTKIMDECLQDVDLNHLPESESVENTEARIKVNPKHGDFRLDSSSFVTFLETLLNEVLTSKDGLLNRILLGIAQSTGTLLGNYIKLNDQDGTAVDLLLPLSTLGLKFESNAIVPGLVLDAGSLRIYKFNKVLQGLSLLNVIGKYTTTNKLVVTPGTLINATVASYMQFDGSAIGQTPGTTVREEVDVNFQMRDFNLDVDLLTAIDPVKFSSRALGQFISVDTNYSFHITENAFDCLMGTFYENGLYSRKLGVTVTDISNVSVKSRTNVLLSPSFENLLRAVTIILVDFYKDATTNICQNCLREYANDFFQKGIAQAKCPSIDNIEMVHFDGDDVLFKFDESPDYLLLMQTWNQSMLEDNYNSLNVVLNTLVNDKTFLDSSKNENIQYFGIPVTYAGNFYGTVDVGLANVIVKDLSFDTLFLGMPYYNETSDPTPYNTWTNVSVPGPIDVQFDVMFNARGLFPEVPSMVNNVRLGLTFQDVKSYMNLTLEVNITEALSLRFNTFNTEQTAPCILLPINALDMDDFQLHLQNITLEVTCLDECDMAMLKELKGFSFHSDNSETAADFFDKYIELIKAELKRIKLQELIDALVSSETCAAILNLVQEFLNSTPPDHVKMLPLLGYVTLALVLSTFILGFALVWLHNKRRQTVLVETFKKNGRTGNFAQVKSMFDQVWVPMWLKFTLPFICLVNVALIAFVYGDDTLGLIWVTTKFTLLGSTTVDVGIIPCTMDLLLQTIWFDVHWLLALFLWIALTLLPIFQNIALIFCWFSPTTILTTKTRGTWLMGIEASAKLNFFMFVLSVMMQSGFYTNIGLFTAFHDIPAEVFLLNVNVQIKSGAYILTTVGLMTLFMSYVLQHTLSKIVKMEENGGVLKKDDEKETKMIVKKSLKKDYRLSNGTIISKQKILVFVGCVSVTILVLILAFFLETFSIKVEGFLGVVLERYDMDVRPISLSSIGKNIYKSPHPNGIYTFGVIFLQVVYFAAFFIIPIASMGLIISALLMDTTIEGFKRQIYVFKRLFWVSSFDLIVIGSIVGAIVLGGLVRSLANWVSGVAVFNLCKTLEPLIGLILGNPSGDYCVDAAVVFNPLFIFPVLALVMQYAMTGLFWNISSVVLKDRRYREENIVPSYTALEVRIIKLFAPKGDGLIGLVPSSASSASSVSSRKEIKSWDGDNPAQQQSSKNPLFIDTGSEPPY